MKINLNTLEVKSFITGIEKLAIVGGGKTANKQCYDASAIDACPTMRGCQ